MQDSHWLLRLLQTSLILALTLKYVEASTSVAPGNIVKLDYGSFQGIKDGDIVKFLGMPFAAPPVGGLRFRPPQSPAKLNGIRQATTYGLACPQQAASLPESAILKLPKNITAGLNNSTTLAVSEDCLFINVIKPAPVKAHQKLPWIYGGGFELGDTSLNPGDSVVNRSITLGEPVIYVSANYRLNAFGFLGGNEALAAGAANVGIKDQRFALQWVHNHTDSFGGSHQSVNWRRWGESAGAISVALHLVINNGNPQGLFRAAIMESGSTMAIRSITDHQGTFDQLVAETGCTGSKDPVACLRAVPFDKFLAAVNNTPNLLSFQSTILSYEPSIDGQFIARSPQTSVLEGSYAKVPIINGDDDDEGTLFSLSSVNVTSDAEFRKYVSAVFLPGISDEDLDAIANAYPATLALGSSFNTGDKNALTPQFKRIAAFQGDIIFQAPRRVLMQAAAKTQPTYGFINKRNKNLPFFGSSHGSELNEFYGLVQDFIAVDALINFVNTMDPNTSKHSNSLLSSIHWPLYNSSVSAPPMLTLFDPVPSVNITTDVFRIPQIQLLTEISRKLHPN